MNNLVYKIDLSKMPDILWVGKTNELPPWRHNGRKMGYHHFAVFTSGECVCQIDNNIYNIKKGSIVFIPAGSFYKFETKSHCEFFFVCFVAKCRALSESEAFSLIKEENNIGHQKDFSFENPSAYYALFYQYASADEEIYSRITGMLAECQFLYQEGTFFDKMLILLNFNKIIVMTSQYMFSRYNIALYPLTLNRMLRYINKNYAKKINVTILSKEFMLSEQYISNIFKNNLNMTVSEYVHSVKLSHAMELLSNSNMNISQISEYLNYSCPYYFSKKFKQHFGVSPKNFSKFN